MNKRFQHLRPCVVSHESLSRPSALAVRLPESEADRRNVIEEIWLTDPLTHLPNRTRLIRDIQANPCPVLYLVNINDFSQINNFFGYPTGDAVLLKMADRLVRAFEATSAFRVYKLPADEFGILATIAETKVDCDEITQADVPWTYLESVAAGIVNAVEQDTSTILCGFDQEIRITLSVTVGAAVALMVGKENLLTHADIALKTAQKEKLPYRFYREARETKGLYRKNLHWAEVIREAVDQQRVVPVYMPIVENATSRIARYEALVRLIDGSGRMLSPKAFLELSKVIRIYPRISRQMLAAVLSDMRQHQTTIAINLGAGDIADADLITYLEQTVQKNTLGDRVVFEILESDCWEQYQVVNRFIERFKALGCAVAIDDFGSGYSNFSHVIQMKVDFIKIDASLIRELDRSASAGVVVRAIVRFAKELGILTVAEGVENQPLFTAVKQLGIDFSQGYFWGKPVDRI